MKTTHPARYQENMESFVVTHGCCYGDPCIRCRKLLFLLEFCLIHFFSRKRYHVLLFFNSITYIHCKLLTDLIYLSVHRPQYCRYELLNSRWLVLDFWKSLYLLWIAQNINYTIENSFNSTLFLLIYRSTFCLCNTFFNKSTYWRQTMYEWHCCTDGIVYHRECLESQNNQFYRCVCI